jgi:lipopolysaccharide export system permease protein
VIAAVLKLDRYIMRNFILGTIPIMVLLLSLFSFLALAEALKNVGEGSFVLFDALNVVALTAPRRFVELLPVTALLGSLMGLGAMANHQELIVIRSMGMSKRRMVRPVLIVALGLAGLALILQLLVIPETERAAARVTSKSLHNTEVGSSGKLDFWTRSNEHFVRVKEVKFNRLLSDVEIYRIDPSGHLTHVFLARFANIIDADDWLLNDVVQSDLSEFEAREEHRASMRWSGLLSSEQAATLILPIEALTPVDLFRYIDYLKDNKLDTHHYRIIFWKQLSIPFSLLAMAMLSLPFLLGSVRHISASQRVSMGGVIGMGFYLLQQITGNLAGLFGMNPALTILAPSFLLLGVAVYGIYRRSL